jgi:DNA ligase-1
MLGALLVEAVASGNAAAPGVRFKIGTGLSNAERSNPPPIGTRVTYRYRGLTEAGVPRFASFLRVAPNTAAATTPAADAIN